LNKLFINIILEKNPPGIAAGRTANPCFEDTKQLI
jgi:hypothetical protein